VHGRTSSAGGHCGGGPVSGKSGESGDHRAGNFGRSRLGAFVIGRHHGIEGKRIFAGSVGHSERNGPSVRPGRHGPAPIFFHASTCTVTRNSNMDTIPYFALDTNA